MLQRFDSLPVLTCSILNKSKQPIVPARRMRIEPKRLLRMLNALHGIPREGRVFSEKDPCVGMIGVYAERCRQFGCPLLRLAREHEHLTQDRMRSGILRVQRHGSLSRFKGARTMWFRCLSPI